ncbi:MAG: hypothetical protein Q8L78_06475 [Coxiellaceae bacterium]|nr:hypothetical protein [Coxiellaceae bacterium]
MTPLAEQLRLILINNPAFVRFFCLFLRRPKKPHAKIANASKNQPDNDDRDKNIRKDEKHQDKKYNHDGQNEVGHNE